LVRFPGNWEIPLAMRGGGIPRNNVYQKYL